MLDKAAFLAAGGTEADFALMDMMVGKRGLEIWLEMCTTGTQAGFGICCVKTRGEANWQRRHSGWKELQPEGVIQRGAENRTAACRTWYNLAIQKRGTVAGRSYSEKQCYKEVLTDCKLRPRNRHTGESKSARGSGWWSVMMTTEQWINRAWLKGVRPSMAALTCPVRGDATLLYSGSNHTVCL